MVKLLGCSALSMKEPVSIGRSVIADDLIHFKSSVVVLDGVPGGEEGGSIIETGIKAIFVKDGTETCTIGFLQRLVSLYPDLQLPT